MNDYRTRIACLCREYRYPWAIGTLLEKLTKSLQIPGTQSVVLSGSASRGELAYAFEGSGLLLFSDLELVVIANQGNASDIQKALSRIEALERRQLEIGVRTFHIDVSFVTPGRWQQRQCKFQAWETRETGKVLFDKDMLDLIKVNVSAKATIQSSLNRLWHLLLYLPARLLREQATVGDRRIFAYALNRAVLDFPLWLLVDKGILVAGFSGRRRYIREHKQMLEDGTFPLHEFASLVDSAMEARERLESEQDIASLYEKVLGWYVRMVGWTLGLPDINASAMPGVIQERHSELYPTLGWKRYAWEARMAGQIALMGGSPLSALKWSGRRKQALVTVFLWCMHQAAFWHLTGKAAEAADWLHLAASRMDRLWPISGDQLEPRSFVDEWTALRRRFFDFIVVFYRGLEANKSYYAFVLKRGQHQGTNCEGYVKW